MKEKILTLVAVFALVLFGAISGVAQDQSAAAPAQTAPAKKHTGKHMAASNAQFGGKQTVSGTVTSVDPDKKLVVLKDSNGIPFDFMVSGATKITSGGKRAKLADLSGDTNKQATVTFMAERKGNMARSIEITQ